MFTDLRDNIEPGILSDSIEQTVYERPDNGETLQWGIFAPPSFDVPDKVIWGFIESNIINQQ